MRRLPTSLLAGIAGALAVLATALPAPATAGGSFSLQLGSGKPGFALSFGRHHPRFVPHLKLRHHHPHAFLRAVPRRHGLHPHLPGFHRHGLPRGLFGRHHHHPRIAVPAPLRLNRPGFHDHHPRFGLFAPRHHPHADLLAPRFHQPRFSGHRHRR